jgi:TP901 family phage tail tape measure protein
MADVNANIGVNIDTSAALAQLKSLQRQISQFNTSIAKSSEQSALAQKSLNTNLINSINSIGAFSAELRTIRTTSEQFTASLESNKFSMREYFRYAGGATKTFGKLFRSEFDTISNVAEERVKKLQTQYIKLGRDSNGAMKAIAVIPKELNMSDYNTQVQIAAQRQALFNQLMKQGSTNLINFGKNTQWAGRQLMVGFTIPLSILGSTATRVFMDMETQAIKFKKVYGDLFTSREETQQALNDIQALGSMYTKYGIAVSQTVGLAAEAAAAGFSGIDLQRQTAQATRLSVLGQVDSQKALETTISLQNAFRTSSAELANQIDFLNAVENQTVVSLDDITTAIPKVAPVIQQLGGDVKDLAFFLAAMKEGGVNASEGANALKSGLAALINPTKRASDMLGGMGINIKGIIETNKGNLRNTVVDFAKALDTLDPLTRARAIEQLFGKFQFARLSTLFDNVTRQGTQAARVLDLASTSVEGLAALSEQELGLTAASSMNKFKKAIEDVKAALVPVGQTFLDAITPIINFVGGILERFNDLSAGTKRVITILTVGLGAVGPVLLMTFGLLANGVGNLIKLFLTLRNGYLRLTGQSQILGEQTQYLTTEQLQAEAVAHSLDQSHAKLTQTFTAETGQLNQLAAAYQRALGAMQRFSVSNPGSMVPPRKMASGGMVVGPGTGTSDSIPAMLSNGETVVPAKQSKKYGGLINGIIADNIPGYQGGLGSAARAHLTAPFSSGSAQFQQGIELAGLQELAAVYPQFIKVVSNLIAELPQSLNILLEKGTASINQFSTAWTAKTNKMLSSVKAGGENISDPAIVTALDSVEQEIHDRTIVLAQGTEGQKVSDDLLSQATREVIEKYKGMSSALGRVTKALDTASQQVGQVRVQPRSNVPGISNAEYLRRGIASGEFTQTGSNVFAGTTQIARESQSTKGKLRPASSFNPAGSYTKQPFRSEPKAVVDSLVMQTADAAQTQSPSRRTIPIGEDIARGLEVGMQNRKDDVARVAGQLGETAVTQSGLIVPRSAMSGSAPLNSLSSRTQVPAEKIKQTE